MRQALRHARETAGLTQKEIATAIGISERYYQHIEAGTREGKGHLWDKLETFLQIPQRQLRSISFKDIPRGGRMQTDEEELST
ncbi:helix-turn-helix domain-containing protein [Dethiosulfovibrio peptidovorans]|uniref:helix-turn-helix domain-containing protein n=1 Tax=Dethiosulfovibrio peptidovorans TaxID=47055 RepID=UPI00019E658B